MRRILLIILVASASSVWAESGGETAIAHAASSEMDALNTWQDLDLWRKRYAPKYDDGFYAEGISDFVERKLVGNWQSLAELVSLSSASPGLFEFAASHLGDITTCKHAKTIVASARDNCPVGLEAYCKQLEDALVPGAAPDCLPELPNHSLQARRR